ncbi:hypothetical protein ACFQY5_08155 [Paeniroseomonas aquatica]|uniref:hypothetical protein n=1 Tax=Paeniroseomonas aquatica TaxID=373043 RepID=UPI0036154269
MPDFDLVIRHGTVATASDVFASDIGISGGKVVALGQQLGAGTREIDATGKLVLPGGIDSHVHIEEPRGGPMVNADSFASGTASAAVGGTTTVIGFARQERGGSMAQGVAEHHARAAGSRIDYSFHMIFTDPRPEILAEEIPGWSPRAPQLQDLPHLRRRPHHRWRGAAGDGRRPAARRAGLHPCRAS